MDYRKSEIYKKERERLKKKEELKKLKKEVGEGQLISMTGKIKVILCILIGFLFYIESKKRKKEELDDQEYVDFDSMTYDEYNEWAKQNNHPTMDD